MERKGVAVQVPSQKRLKSLQGFDKAQWGQLVFSLRKWVYQIIIYQPNVLSQQWKQLELSLESAIGAAESAAALISLLKNLQSSARNQSLSRFESSSQGNFQLKDRISLYLLEPIILKQASQTQKLWKYRELYFEGERLLKEVASSECNSFDKGRLRVVLLMNKVACCLHLESYQKGLETIDQLRAISQANDEKFLNQLQFLKNTILLKMGCRVKTKLSKSKGGGLKYDQDSCSEKIRNESELCLKIMTFDKYSLASFIQHLRFTEMSLSVRNLYNLALVCKRHKEFECSVSILKKIINLAQIKNSTGLKYKCLVLLSQIEEEKGSTWCALEVLKQIKVISENDKKEWLFRRERLERKFRLEKGAVKCPIINPKSVIKFNLLCDLENQLTRLKDSKEKTQLAAKKSASHLYQIITRKKTLKRMTTVSDCQEAKSFDSQLTKCCSSNTNDENAQPTQLQVKQILYGSKQVLQYQQTISSKQKEVQLQQIKKISKFSSYQPSTNAHAHTIKSELQEGRDKEDQVQKEQNLAIKAASQVQKSTKKGVRFNQADQNEQTVEGIVQKAEEQIISFFVSQNYDRITPEIRQSLSKISQEKQSPLFQKFVIKCIDWYCLLGKHTQAISLLKTIINKVKGQKGCMKLKMCCLEMLAVVYQQLKDSKNAREVYLQLANLGQAEYYIKLGELQFMSQNYNESVKYFERYHELKLNLCSQSKLAHAYSKTGIYRKKAIELLNEMLFENKNQTVLKRFSAQDSEHVQNAVMLLVSIYMNDQPGSDKARNVCDMYLETNYSAYPVFYMLGLINEREGKKEEAFQNYLTVLKLKPNHLPSLIRIVNDIGIGNSNNFEITNILRKAFMQNNRNWQLLCLLVQSITLSKQESKEVTVEQLVRCAKVLEKADIKIKQKDLGLEIEMVWTWAFQLAEDRRCSAQPSEHQLENEIYMKLSEINMAKGNLKACQFYLKKVLGKLELRRKRTQRRRGIVKYELQAMQRLSYIRSRQNESAEEKAFKGDELATSPECQIESKLEISKKLGSIFPRRAHFDINKL